MDNDEVMQFEQDPETPCTWVKKNPPGTFEEAFDSVVADLRDLMVSKQKDYGPGNITAHGEYGVMVRASDKVARLNNLLNKNEKDKIVRNESVEDSWKDLANYAIIALMLRRGTFLLPLDEVRNYTAGRDQA